MTIKKMRRYLKWMAFYPPYIGTGVWIKDVNEECTRFEVIMKLRWYNRNIYGTHFGGSLYSMCDPWFAFIVSAYVGQDYIIWDKSAAIEYISPGKGTVSAVFEIADHELKVMKSQVDKEGRGAFTFYTYIVTKEGVKVAHVEKEVYVRKKNFLKV